LEELEKLDKLEEITQQYREENQKNLDTIQALQKELEQKNLEIKKYARELRVSNSFLDKVSRTIDAKETLNSALTEANKKQRAYTDVLLESCSNIIMLLDEEGRFVLSTQVLLTQTKTPNFDYIKKRKYGEFLSRYFSDEGMRDFDAAFEKVMGSDEICHFDSLVDFAQNGQPRFYSFELRRAGTEKAEKGVKMSGVLAVMLDFTDIMKEKQKAEAANNAKSEFLATMSHEIRTPMNAIIGMGEMLDRSELNPAQKRYVYDIKKSSNALLAIINDILDFSKIEAGKMELVNTTFNLKMLLDNLGSMFSMLCRNKKLEMRKRIDESVPEFVCADETRIRQILTNILANAVKYTEKGSVSFFVYAKDNVLRFAIKDTGAGIKEEEKSKLFKPFEQLNARKNRNVVGTGLGLAITYNLCILMGGELWVDSEYGKGSTFYVEIPYEPAEQAEIEETARLGEFVAPGAKVLVVDDIDINLSVAEALLGAFEIVPDLAQSGKQALEFAEKSEYDLIFMDHMMPEMDGLETTKRIRALGGKNDKVPIVALTANAISGMEQMFLQNRLDDFLPKPIDIATLNLCLRKWLPKNIMEEKTEQNA